MIQSKPGKPPSGSLILGVDGGGSKTVACVAETSFSGSPRILGTGRGGPSNCRSVGFEQAIANLQKTVAAAFTDAQLKPTRVESACLALAGADRQIEKERFQYWAEENSLADVVVVNNDALPTIYAGFPDGVGMGLIAGTGSLAIARSEDGRLQRCGGWGGLFGDEGSGYDIAIESLRAAARDEDQRGPSTMLRPAWLKSLKVATLNDAIPTLYNPSTNRKQIAAFTPHIFKIANAGDRVATEILEKAASQLAQLVTTLARQTHFTSNALRLALTGGMLKNQPEFTENVIRRIQETDPRVTETVIVPEPVRGAINIATRAISS